MLIQYTTNCIISPFSRRGTILFESFALACNLCVQIHLRSSIIISGTYLNYFAHEHKGSCILCRLIFSVILDWYSRFHLKLSARESRPNPRPSDSTVSWGLCACQLADDHWSEDSLHGCLGEHGKKRTCVSWRQANMETRMWNFGGLMSAFVHALFRVGAYVCS